MLLAAIAAGLTVSSGASAWGVPDAVFSGSAGAGALTSYLVIDFGADSYAFKFLHDGGVSGWDMMLAVDAAVPDLAITYSNFGGGSVFVDTVAYGGHPATGGGTTWWSYWFSETGQDWGFADVGAGARALSDGSWDGWSFVESFTAQAMPPDVPLVPEPSSLLALCVPAAALLRLRGRL